MVTAASTTVAAGTAAATGTAISGAEILSAALGLGSLAASFGWSAAAEARADKKSDILLAKSAKEQAIASDRADANQPRIANTINKYVDAERRRSIYGWR